MVYKFKDLSHILYNCIFLRHLSYFPPKEIRYTKKNFKRFIMGMFDVQFSKKINLKKGNNDIFEFLKKQVQKNKTYEDKVEKNALIIEKCKINTLLRYNLEISVQTNKKNKDSDIIINGELHDTLLLTILVILSIILTYGIGIIPVIGFTYYQKIVATKQLETLIENYKCTI